MVRDSEKRISFGRPALLTAFALSGAAAERRGYCPTTLARYGGTLYNQAVVHSHLRYLDRASELFEEAIKIQQRSVRLEPDVAQYSRLLALSLQQYGLVFADSNNPERLDAVRHQLADLSAREAHHAK